MLSWKLLGEQVQGQWTLVVQTWKFEELVAEIGGFHDGQPKPRSSGRPDEMSEDGSRTCLARHVEWGSLKEGNSQGAVCARNHGWGTVPSDRVMRTRLARKGEHFGDVAVVGSDTGDTRWEWGGGEVGGRQPANPRVGGVVWKAMAA